MVQKNGDLKPLKYSVYSFLLLLILVALYFIFNPIFLKGIRLSISPKNLANLTQARNYYSVLQSIFTIIIGLLGIGLGFFYYIHKLEVERENESNKNKKANLEKLYNEITIYDQQVHLLFSKILSDSDYEEHLLFIERSWAIIECMIEPKLMLFDFNDNDIGVILSVNSLIDNIIQSEQKITTIEELEKVKTFYDSSIRQVRTIFLSSIK